MIFIQREMKRKRHEEKFVFVFKKIYEALGDVKNAFCEYCHDLLNTTD